MINKSLDASINVYEVEIMESVNTSKSTLLLKALICCWLCVMISDVTVANATSLSKLQRFAENGFDPKIEGLRIDGGILKNDLKRRFGEPLRESIKKEPDIREPGVILEFLTLEYPGLTIVISRPINQTSTSDEYWISEIILSNPAFTLKYGMKVGQPKHIFLKHLGIPDEDADSIIRYSTDNYTTINNVNFAGHVQISIEFDDKKNVKKIRWKYIAD